MVGKVLVCSLLIAGILLGAADAIESSQLGNDDNQRALKPFEGPIFREAGDATTTEEQPTSEEPARRVTSSPNNDYVSRGGRPFRWPPVLEPGAYFGMHEPEASWVRKSSAEYRAWLLEKYPDIEPGRLDKLCQCHIAIRPRVIMIDALKPYLPNVNNDIDYYKIRLGASRNPMDIQLALGADIHDWVPDAFSDSEIMRLFGAHARMRELLARSAETGETSMSNEQQNAINTEVREAYFAALQGWPLTSSYEPTGDDNSPCTICMESNIDEPWLKLSCDHKFHKDCLANWFHSQVADSLDNPLKFCPLCRTRYRWPVLDGQDFPAN